MRANTQAIRSLPNYKEFPDNWAILSFPSIAAAITARKTYALTENESDNWGGNSGYWSGLGSQSRDSFLESRINVKARDMLQASMATLPKKFSRMSNPRAAVTGSFWDVPAVLANIPLAARTRQRAKLAPINLKIGACFSGGIKDKDLAPIFAKLARAIWDYVQAGGVVTLDVMTPCQTLGPDRLKIIVMTRVNTSDLAALSAALSVSYLRAISGPLSTAVSLRSRDSLGVLDTIPASVCPGVTHMGGVLQEIFPAAEKLMKQLEIS